MSENTKIEWADNSWSPWRGCTKVSAGCAHCYAETLSKRNPAVLGQWGKGKPRVLAKNWNDPVKWNRKEAGKTVTHEEFYNAQRPRVFPSLCDWLDEDVPIEWLARFLNLIHDTPNLDWLLLTKRPENFRDRLITAIKSWTWADPADVKDRIEAWVDGSRLFQNVWIGTSVEDQSNADRRIPALLKIPARLRFLSVEPMLGPVDLKLMRRSFGFPQHITKDGHAVGMPQGIHWIIFGGESGPGSRPCNVDWIRDGVRQCAAAGVACFVKQLGAVPVYTAAGIEFSSDDGMDNVRAHWTDPGWMIHWNSAHNSAQKITHSKGGDPEEWPEDLRVRQFPEAKP